jgi:hypothetical protein
MGKTCARGLYCDLEEVGPYHKGNLEPPCPRGVDESPPDTYESSVEIILVIILRAVCFSCNCHNLHCLFQICSDRGDLEDNFVGRFRDITERD